MKKNFDNFVKFLGIKINDTSFEGIREIIRSHLEKKAYICLLDATNIIRATKDEELSLAINSFKGLLCYNKKTIPNPP